jgi:hypothetical protein
MFGLLHCLLLGWEIGGWREGEMVGLEGVGVGDWEHTTAVVDFFYFR